MTWERGKAARARRRRRTRSDPADLSYFIRGVRSSIDYVTTARSLCDTVVARRGDGEGASVDRTGRGEGGWRHAMVPRVWRRDRTAPCARRWSGGANGHNMTRDTQRSRSRERGTEIVTEIDVRRNEKDEVRRTTRTIRASGSRDCPAVARISQISALYASHSHWLYFPLTPAMVATLHVSIGDTHAHDASRYSRLLIYIRRRTHSEHTHTHTHTYTHTHTHTRTRARARYMIDELP